MFPLYLAHTDGKQTDRRSNRRMAILMFENNKWKQLEIRIASLWYSQRARFCKEIIWFISSFSLIQQFLKFWTRWVRCKKNGYVDKSKNSRLPQFKNYQDKSFISGLFFLTNLTFFLNKLTIFKPPYMSFSINYKRKYKIAIKFQNSIYG